MTIQLRSAIPGETITARRLPVAVVLDLVAELPPNIRIAIRADEGDRAVEPLPTWPERERRSLARMIDAVAGVMRRGAGR